MSPKSTSLMPPSETRCEKPMPRATAQSSTAVSIAPDWVKNAVAAPSASRGRSWRSASCAGASTPMQLGPTMRKVNGLAASSICVCIDLPPAPVSANPADSTTMALVPLAPSCAIRSGTLAAGVATTASSGAEGRASTLANTGLPARSCAFGLTSQTGPANLPASRFRATTPPTECSSRLAPIKAMLLGVKKLCRLRIDMRNPAPNG